MMFIVIVSFSYVCFPRKGTVRLACGEVRWRISLTVRMETDRNSTQQTEIVRKYKEKVKVVSLVLQ